MTIRISSNTKGSLQYVFFKVLTFWDIGNTKDYLLIHLKHTIKCNTLSQDHLVYLLVCFYPQIY
jgi:hypothetical protein